MRSHAPCLGPRPAFIQSSHRAFTGGLKHCCQGGGIVDRVVAPPSFACPLACLPRQLPLAACVGASAGPKAFHHSPVCGWCGSLKCGGVAPLCVSGVALLIVSEAFKAEHRAGRLTAGAELHGTLNRPAITALAAQL